MCNEQQANHVLMRNNDQKKIEVPFQPQDSIENRDVGRVVKFHCDAGFMMIGRPVSTCGLSGVWSTPTPRCITACTYPGGLIGGQIVGEVKVRKENCQANFVNVSPLMNAI